MRIDILTLFKEQFKGFLETSIIKRAIDKKQVEINLIDIRDFVQYEKSDCQARGNYEPLLAGG